MPSTGSEQLRIIAAQCKALGDRGLLNRTRATLRAEAKPMVKAAQQAAYEQLPKAGGLNVQVASQPWTVQTLAGARTAGVRLRTKAPDTLQTDDGFVRHPIYGHRGKGQWRTQPIPQAKGWASDTVRRRGPAVAAAMIAELNRVATAVARSVGGA